MLTGLSAAALALHAVLLSGLDLTWPGGDVLAPRSASVQAAEQVRTLMEPVPVSAALPAEVVDTPMVSAPVKAAAKAEPSIATTAKPFVAQALHTPQAPNAVRVAAAVVAPAADLAPVGNGPNVALPEITPVAAPASDTLLALDTTHADSPKAAASPESKPAADEVVPVYRTRLPPAATLRFRMQRGGLSGTADLAWRPSGSHYELHFDGKVAGLTILTQVSSGGIEANGLAPVRFSDQRLRRAVTATNFQREAGKITFSGPSDEFPLWPGVQDRLSWMIQLSAIVQADAKLAQPGAKVAMHVVGARADAGVWVFRCVARETVDAAGGAAQAAKFVREPRSPYDTAAEVWLDPQRHDLPVRAALRSGDGDALELILEDANISP